MESDLNREIAGPAHIEASDIDQDGDLDLLVASTGMIAPSNDKIGAVIVLENLGSQTFAKQVLAVDPPHLLALDAGDMDGDGKIELVTGGFHLSPPFENMSRILLWDQP